MERGEGYLEGGKALERLVYFSDAVFAIAITLLVLDIHLPDGLDERELPAALGSLWPKYLSYFISFTVIGLYWMAHHRVFGYIKRLDGRLVFLNLMFLMSVAFMPFPASVVSEYGDTQTAVVVYAASLMVTGLLLNAMSWYSVRGRRLTDADLDPRTVRHMMARGLITPTVCVLVIALSFFDTDVALYSLALIFVARRAVVWLIERRA